MEIGQKTRVVTILPKEWNPRPQNKISRSIIKNSFLDLKKPLGHVVSTHQTEGFCL